MIFSLFRGPHRVPLFSVLGLHCVRDDIQCATPPCPAPPHPVAVFRGQSPLCVRGDIRVEMYRFQPLCVNCFRLEFSIFHRADVTQKLSSSKSRSQPFSVSPRWFRWHPAVVFGTVSVLCVRGDNCVCVWAPGSGVRPASVWRCRVGRGRWTAAGAAGETGAPAVAPAAPVCRAPRDTVTDPCLPTAASTVSGRGAATAPAPHR